jgi:hypothetical protein
VAGLGMPLSFSPSALFSAGGAAAAQLHGPATGGGAQGAFTFPAPPPATLYAPRPTSALAAVLVSARAAAAAGQERVRAAALAWQRERDESYIPIKSSPLVSLAVYDLHPWLTFIV